MMRVLVTGGAGFIGSQVADAFLSRGDDVVVVDSLVSGRREFVSPKARFYQADIRDPALREIFARERPHIVNHHAAQASVTASVADAPFDADVNVLGTLRILDHCVATGVEHVVFASTGGALYGEPDRLPADESTPIRPLSPYGASKHAAEGYLSLYSRLYGLRACALRYANVYGPRQDPHGEAGVVAIFTNALLQGKTPTIHGDGEQTRDFVYVDDVVRASLLATDRRAVGAWNIGTGVALSVNTLYDQLAAAVGIATRAIHGPPRPGDVRHITLDARGAREHLGWTPQTTIDAGVNATVDWFRRR